MTLSQNNLNERSWTRSVRDSMHLWSPSNKDGGFIEEHTNTVCIKVFNVVTIILAAIVMTAGILALLTSKGIFPPDMSVNNLKVIGEVNSYMMTLGGVALFTLGLIAWIFDLNN